MRRRVLKLLFSVTVALLLGKCAQTGVPMPPSLELPKPVTDLKAVRKGDKVNLTWTMPSRTSDGQKVRYVGPTRICRSLQAAMTACGTVVGEVAAIPRKKRDDIGVVVETRAFRGDIVGHDQIGVLR